MMSLGLVSFFCWLIAMLVFTHGTLGQECENGFWCLSEECIPANRECDGEQDCEDGSDEHILCESENGFACLNQESIPANWECDGKQDCDDGSDEHCDCENVFACLNEECIPANWVCDGEPDCEEDHDEHECAAWQYPSNWETCSVTCGGGTQSRTQTCININDGSTADPQTLCAGDPSTETQDCNTDECHCENGFACPNEECIPANWVCDGLQDCEDGSDEHIECECENGFACLTEECIPANWECDGEPDCEDDSDEHIECECEGFTCSNGECIHTWQECNILLDCADYSDEHEGCPGCGCDEGDRCDDFRNCLDESDEIGCFGAFEEGCPIVFGTEVDATFITISWEEQMHSQICYPFTGLKFEVFLKNEDNCMPIEGSGTKVSEVVRHFDYGYDMQEPITTSIGVDTLHPYSTFDVVISGIMYEEGRFVEPCLPLPPFITMTETTLESDPSTGPTNLIATSLTPSSLQLSWEPAVCGNRNRDVTDYDYVCYYHAIGDGEDEKATQEIYTSTTSATLNDLPCNTGFYFDVYHSSFSDGSAGPPSSVTVWTITTAPSSILGSQSGTELSFTWKPPTCVSAVNPISVYQYVLCPAELSIINGVCGGAGANRKRRQANMMTGQTNTNGLTITDLPCDSDYNFVLTAINDDGFGGDSSAPYPISTGVNAPVAVSGQLVTTSVSGGVELSWSPPSTTCTSAATDYLVEYALTHQDDCIDIPVPSIISYGVVSETAITVTGLLPRSIYMLYVTPANSGGSGPTRSTTWRTPTAKVPPVSPTEVINTDRTSTSLSFEWKTIPCGQQHGPINSYTYRLSLGSTGEIIQEYSFYLPDSPFTTVYNLLPDVQYGFQVSADIVYGDNITGPFSSVILATTLSSIVTTTPALDTTPAVPASIIYIDPPSYSVNEDSDYVNIIIRRTQGILSSPDIVVRTVSGSALAGEDFVPLINVVTFATSSVDEETRSITVTIISDERFEGNNENFFVEISGSAVSDGTMRAVVRINDDDPAAPTLPMATQSPTGFKFDMPFYYVSELGGGTLPFNVIRTGNNDGTVILRVETEGTSAFSPQDYTAIDETIEFSPGQMVVSSSVQINADTTREGPETFVLRLWSGNSLLDQSQVTITEGEVNFDRTIVSCPRETFSSPYGNINMASDIVGAVSQSSTLCPINTQNAGAPVTTATCELDVDGASAYWNWEVNCGSEHSTDQVLQQLAAQPITIDNAMEIISTAEELTTTAGIDQMGISNAAHVVEQVVALALPDPEITMNIVKIVDHLMDINEDLLLEANTINHSPSRTVAAMEEQLQNVELTTYGFYRQVEKNVAVEVVNASPDDFLSGLGVVSYDRIGTRRTDLTIIHGELPSDELPEVAMFLPLDLANMDMFDSEAKVRATFIVLNISSVLPSKSLADSNKELKDFGYQRSVNSHVISVIVGGRDMSQLTQPVKAMYRPIHPRANNTECVFWDFSLNDWSSDGCRSVSEIRGLQQCECDHLTNFAVLMDIYGQTTLTKTQDYILEILSYVGCCLSVLGLTATVITYGTSKKLRTRKPNKILINLCVALIGLYVVFIAMISVDTERGKSEVSGIACGVLAGLLQYFTLASLCWMAVEAFNMYRLFVKVVNSYVSKLLVKAAIVGWGVPGIIVVATGAASRTSYTRSDFCFLQTLPLVGGVLAPIGMIVIVNVVVFVLIMRSLSRRSPASSAFQEMQRKKRLRRLRNAVAILLLLGLTWAVGFLGLIKAATFISQLLFCVLNSMQGYLIFMMYCVQQPEVRNHWRRMLGRSTAMGMKRTPPGHSHSHTPPMKYSDAQNSTAASAMTH